MERPLPIFVGVLSIALARSVAVRPGRCPRETAAPVRPEDLRQEKTSCSEEPEAWTPPRTALGRSGDRGGVHQQRRERDPVRASCAVRRAKSRRCTPASWRPS